MRKICEVDFGFSDAENYKRKENKQLFQKFFVKNDYLDALLKPSINFLVGEKGTGKTAYGIFLSNTDHKNTKSTLKFIRETEYSKFVELKKTHNLGLSDYTEIWKTLILLLFCEHLLSNLDASFFGKNRGATGRIKQAIDEFYNNAFSPEIITALNFVEHSEIAAKLISKYAEVGGKVSESTEASANRFQTNLLYIRRKFEEVIASASLDRDYLLFIDGIDIRPSAIQFNDYLECIKGLANAVWFLNNDFFSEIKDSKGRLRAVLLVRPDIFLTLGLQNPNTKLRDNSVQLDWSTTYELYRTSNIFEVVDNLLSVQQDKSCTLGESWDFYFPFYTPKQGAKHRNDNSFIYFLRNSYYRPRDILTYISIFKKHIDPTKRKSLSYFTEDFCDKREISGEYADYLLGELRDQLVFYYSQVEYEDFLQFFDFLDGKTRFNYKEYLDAHGRFFLDLKSRKETVPSFMGTSNGFLQFLYDMNVICYVEETEKSQTLIHWSFRERSLGKLAPKIKSECRYEVHYGLVPALNMGQKRKRR